MPFLSKADLTSVMYAEDIDAITEGDDTIVETHISTAIAEAQGYLSRYDIAALFNRTDIARDPILLASCKALAVWYLVAACPANQNTKDVEKRADEARAWLRGVQNGKLKPINWPAVSPVEQSTFFHVASQDKRNNDI